MSESTTEGGIVLPAGVKDRQAPRVSDGSCPDCGAKKESFAPHFGGTETCMQCGHDREQAAPNG